MTYVSVYNATPTAVTFGYTAGYLGTYVGFGTVAFGTGFYYPPYVAFGVGAVPVYYPAPVTYGVAAHYNTATGTYTRGVQGYGPYGGFRAGTSYNPTTGTYARGAQYNTETGPRGVAEAYNPRTGTMAASTREATPTGSGDTARVPDRQPLGGERACHGQRGKRGRISSRYRQYSGAVAQSSATGDVYAGHDGNVYRDTSSGWQKYGGNGQWNSASHGEPDSATRQDSFAREDGVNRTQSFESRQDHFGGFAGRAGGFRGGGFRGR